MTGWVRIDDRGGTIYGGCEGRRRRTTTELALVLLNDEPQSKGAKNLGVPMLLQRNNKGLRTAIVGSPVIQARCSQYFLQSPLKSE